MESLPTLIVDLTLILFTAAIASIIFKKLNQPAVLGYIVAGFLAGPYMPYTASIVDAEAIHTWGDIGVIFILFSLGLEFSFKKLLKIGSTPIIAVTTSLLCMTGIGIGVSAIFGWGQMTGLYLGGMLAMSSTSIIVKAFDDLGVKQQSFASSVFSVLILEDIIAIVLMVLFGMMGKDGKVDGEVILENIVWMLIYIVGWFVMGIYLIPLILKKIKGFLNNELLLIVSLALCFIMVALAQQAGFSAAFGAFVMGSIMAETTESEHIEKVIVPVKDLFGAIFFVSVGMMIQPAMLAEHWLPILVLTLVMVILRSTVDSFAFALGGLNIKDSIKCGYSLAQVGEFSFIIASLGVAIGAIEDFIYPIIVSVSVITTFTTPFMIRAAEPVYNKIEPLIPEKLKKESRRNAAANKASATKNSKWKGIIRDSVLIMVIYSVLCTLVGAVCDNYLYPLFEEYISAEGWVAFLTPLESIPAIYNYMTTVDPAKLLTVIIALTTMLIFIKPLLTTGLFDERFWKLWNDKKFNRAPLIFIIILRALLAIALVTGTIGYLYKSVYAILTGLVFFIIEYVMMHKRITLGVIKMEGVFNDNLTAKERATHPVYEGDLLNKDIHLSEITLPENSKWCGRKIMDCDWGRTYDVHIASIVRESGRINIPSAETRIFPGDKIQILGTDDNLTAFAASLTAKENTVEIHTTSVVNTMEMKSVSIPDGSLYDGLTIADCGIRDEFHCMIVGIDRGEENCLIKPTAKVEILSGDTLFVVGEDKDVQALQAKAMEIKKAANED